MNKYKIIVEANKLFLLNSTLPNRKRNIGINASVRNVELKNNILNYFVKDSYGSKRVHVASIQFNEPLTSKTQSIELFKKKDLKVKCDCEDFRYRFAYKATKLNFNALPVNERRPAKKTNPQNLGALCKHLYFVFKNFDKSLNYVKFPKSKIDKK